MLLNLFHGAAHPCGWGWIPAFSEQEILNVVSHDVLSSSFSQFQRALFLTKHQEERTKIVEGVPTVKLDPLQCRFSTWPLLWVLGREREEKGRGLKRRNTQSLSTIFKMKEENLNNLKEKTALVFSSPFSHNQLPNPITNTSKQNNRKKIRILLPNKERSVSKFKC